MGHNASSRNNTDFQITGDDPLLVIQPLVGIGDMVWHKPWIDQMIATNHVILATKHASQPHILFADRLPEAQILPIERNSRGIRGRHDGLLGLLRMAADFKRTGARRALILHHSNSYRRALWLAGIKQIAGFGFGKMKGLYGQMLAPADTQIHAIERMKKFWQINGWPMPKQGWQIGVSQAESARALHVMSQQALVPDKTIFLGIGAMHEDRCWPAARFAELIIKMRHNRPDLQCAIMGGPAERRIADEIQQHLSAHDEPPVAAIFEGFATAIAALSLAKGYVGNDTSLLNIAAVLGTASLGLFSQSPPLDYVESLHHLDVLAPSDYGTPGIILKITVDDVCVGIDDIWQKEVG